MTSHTPTRFLDRTTPPHIFTLIVLTGLSALSMNIFLPSLPAMTEYFATDYKVMQLSVALYLGVNAALQLIIGPISDNLGRRPVILWGIALYLIATLGCIIAPNVTIFLFFRLCQAAIVVGMVLGRAVVRDICEGARAASMMAYVTMGMAVVPMVGPMVGGFVDSTFGWHGNFWLLFILGVATFALIYADLGETKARSGTTLRAQFKTYPELLSSPRFWGYSLTNAFSSGAFFAFLGGAPFVGTQVFGLSSTELGVYFGTPAFGYFLGNFVSGRFSERFGLNAMCKHGSHLVFATSCLLLVLAYADLLTPVSFFGLISFIGLGNGMTIPNATTGSMSVRPHLAGTAAGLNGAILLGGGALLSALAGAMLEPGTGAFPLLWIMFLSTGGGVIAIHAVIRRARKLAIE